jgi:hypothetical protein
MITWEKLEIWQDIDGDLFSSYGEILIVICFHHTVNQEILVMGLFWPLNTKCQN